MSSIDHNTYMTPDLSLGLDDTPSSVSLSPTTPLQNMLLSSGDFSHGSRSLSGSLGGSLYESPAYTRNTQDKCRQLEWELSKEKMDHMKLRKEFHFRILQYNT